MTHHNPADYILFCSSGSIAVGIGNLLKVLPSPESIAGAIVLSAVGAMVGGLVKLGFDVLRARWGHHLGLKQKK